MKKVLLTMLLLPTLAMAQKNEKSACKRLENGFNWMKDSLALTTDQQTKICALKNHACSALNEAKINSRGDKEKFKSAAHEIIKQYRQNARKELTPVQKEKLKAKHLASKKDKQHGKGEPTPEKRAERMTQNMKTNLELDSAQTSKVYTANLRFTKCQEAIREKRKAGVDSNQIRQEMQQCAKTHKSDLKSILTAEQWKKFEGLQQERREKLKQRRKP